jgi:hypothetical protein
MRIDRSAPRATRKTTTASANTLPSSNSVEPVPPSPEKKIDSRMIAPKVGDRGGGDDQLTEGREDLARVLEHRHQHAERRRAEDDRHQQRRLDQSSGLQAERHEQGDGERHGKPESGETKHLPTQLVELDLETSEEQHERKPDQGDDLDRLVDLDDPEHRRPSDDPGHDLEHDGRQPHAREQAQHERGAEGDGDDDEEVVERGHAP